MEISKCNLMMSKLLKSKLQIRICCIIMLSIFVFLHAHKSLQAHPLSSTYLDITVKQENLSAEINIPLLWVLNFSDSDSPEQVANILNSKKDSIKSNILNNLIFKSDNNECLKIPGDTNLSYFPDGAYFTLFFKIDCGLLPKNVLIHYNLYFDKVLDHPAFLSIKDNDTAEQTYVLTKERPEQIINLKEPSFWQQFKEFIQLGVKHIFSGFDHILFILLLLLPAFLTRSIIRKILIVISSFTVAHSITLTLATLKILTLPTRFAESTIALSIVVAALMNILFLAKKDQWGVAFIFGLIHGFGFASVLSGYNLPASQLIKGLLGFNIGVEIGQLLIVCLLFPIFYYIKKYPLYRRYIIPSVSAISGCIAFIWLIERSFNIQLFSSLFK